MEQNIEAAYSRFEQAKINYSNGLVPKLSVLSAQVGYENLTKKERKILDQSSAYLRDKEKNQ